MFYVIETPTQGWADSGDIKHTSTYLWVYYVAAVNITVVLKRCAVSSF